MKVYQKCERCSGKGHIQRGVVGKVCPDCDGSGNIETEIPVEQALEALKDTAKLLFTMGNQGGETYRNTIRAIKAIQECIK